MKRALFVLGVLALAACSRYPKLPVDQYQKMLSETPDVQLLDVRTPAEFAEGHIPGAMNIDWREDDFMQQVEAQLDKTRPLMVYCRSGRRSESAAIALEEAGFDTYDLKNGFLAWANAGKPVDHSQDIRYTVASGYFFRNDAVIDILPHSITSENELLNYFGRAAVMGTGGLPTAIDFEKSMVIPVVLPPTDKETEIVIDSLLRTGDDQIRLAFHVERGNESRSYTISPCKLLVVDAAYRDFDILISSPEKY